MTQPLGTVAPRRGTVVAVAAAGATGAAGVRILWAWVGSVVVHAGLFGVMVVQPLLSDLVDSDGELPIARTSLIGELHTEQVATSPTPSLSTSTAVKPEVQQHRPKRFDTMASLARPQRPELSIIGIGTGGGEFARYGLNIAGANGGPRFFGLGAKARGARRIVYVVDRSGSMLTTFDAVRQELIRSINALRRSQKFHVIFFNSGPPVENPPRQLVSAVKSRKNQTLRFLKTIEPWGNTDPAPAMRRAFAVHPDVIYFLTDGEFDSRLLGKLAEWNHDRRVRIFSIAYFNRLGAALLERIAREHNGEFRYVSEYDLP